MSFWKDPVFWIVVCALGFLACVVYATIGWGTSRGAHARTDPEPEPAPTPLESTTLLGPALPVEGTTATCRKCHLPITMLGGDWTCTEGQMYGLTNCGADLSAPYTPHEPASPPASSSLPYEGDPFAHAGAGMATEEDGEQFVAALRGDEVAVAAAVARERAVEPPPVPPVPFVSSLPVFSAPPAAAPLEPLPPMGRPVPPEDGDDKTEREYRRQVTALRAVMPDAEPQAEPPQAGAAVRESADLPAVLAGRRIAARRLGAGDWGRLHAALTAWDPANPYKPPPAEPETAAVTQDQPVTAGDETREIFLGLARQMNWLTPAEQVALWDREFCTPITVGGGTPAKAVPAPWVNEGGSSLAGLPSGDWKGSAPLSLPGGQRPAAEADGSDAA